MQENEPLDEKMTVLEYVRSIGEYVTTATGKATASQMCERFLIYAENAVDTDRKVIWW